MSAHDINKAYVSPFDKFLFEFDATHAKSASQIKEISKADKIALMRDDAEYKKPNSEIWEEF